MTGWQNREKELWHVVVRYIGLLGLIWSLFIDHLLHPYMLPVWVVMMGLEATGLLPGGNGKKGNE